jgi:transposase
LHIGELPAVRVPTELEEAARDLVRAREDARSDLMRARHRLSKLLLGQGLVFEGAAWTQAHGRWLASVGRELVQPGLRVAVDEATIKAVQHDLGHKSASITLDHYGYLFPEELDHLADRLDRLHAQAGVYPTCTEAPVAALGQGKGPGR